MIALIDLKKQYSLIESKIKTAVNKVLDSGQYIMGPEVEALERRMAEYVGAKHCISCASGTDALYMALLAKGVKAGDLIITTPFTFFATAEVIALLGAVPIFVDVEHDTFNISVKGIKHAIEAIKHNDSSIYPLPKNTEISLERLKGIIAVDLFGLPAEYELINEIAEKHGIFVIEDSAQSFGASYNGRKTGSLAEIACTSFFPAKPLGCYGDGGAIFCNDDDLANTLRSIRVHGQGVDKYENVRLGVTGRLDAIQAAILNVKLDIFDNEIESRQRVANSYAEHFKNSSFVTPEIKDGYVSAWAQYTIYNKDTSERKSYLEKLSSLNIGNSIYYPIPLHKQKVFEYLGYGENDFPVSNDLANKVFSIPMHPYLSEEEIREVVKALTE